MISKRGIYRYLVVFCILLILVAGCGYRFAGGGSLPTGTGAICVSIFENRSSDSMFETRLTNDVINELIRNRLKVAKRETDADSVMTGVVRSISTESATRTTSLTSMEKRLRVTVAVVLKDRDGNVLWEKNELKYEQLYEVPTPSNNSQENKKRKEALEILSERFAAGLYAAMTENF